jgi:hypothetical protein
MLAKVLLWYKLCPLSPSPGHRLIQLSLLWHEFQLLKLIKKYTSKEMMEHISGYSLSLPGLLYKYCGWGGGEKDFKILFEVLKT